jgi:bacteriorhodopsin
VAYRGRPSSITSFCHGFGKAVPHNFIVYLLLTPLSPRVVSYLVSAFTTSTYKWGFFTFGTVAYLILAFNTISYGRTSATRLGVASHHTFLSGWTNLLWLLWPIAFGVSDGGRVIGVTPTAIFFGVLDVLLTPVLGFAFSFLSRRWDYNRLNIAFTRYGRVHDAGQHPEKAAVAPAHGGVTTGAPAV